MSLLTDPVPLLRVAVVFLVLVIFIFAVVFVFLFFVRPFTDEDIGSDRVIRSDVFCIHSLHDQWYASPSHGNDKVHGLL